jgi:hypothetical protein
MFLEKEAEFTYEELLWQKMVRIILCLAAEC